jgi:hypothetical protein
VHPSSPRQQHETKDHLSTKAGAVQALTHGHWGLFGIPDESLVSIATSVTSTLSHPRSCTSAVSVPPVGQPDNRSGVPPYQKFRPAGVSRCIAYQVVGDQKQRPPVPGQVVG